MAKQNKGNKKTKAKSTKRAQNAFEIAQKVESLNRKGGASDSEDDDVNTAIHKFKNNPDDDSEDFEDEEIDSDEALGDDDDFDVLNSKFSQTIRDRQKKNKSSKKSNNGSISDEDDEEEAYDSIDEDELLPLSAVWDMDDADSKKSKSKDLVLDENISSEEEQSEEDDSESESESEYDDSDVDNFPDFSDLENSQGEESDIELNTLKTALQKKEKRAKKHYQDFQVQENELALPGGGNEITLTDMISVVDGDASKRAILIDKEESETSGKHLPIPLPQRIQQRHERKAAYEITKEEVNKWKDTVKQNRDAEVLSFPLNPEVEHNPVSTFTESKPINELESKINSLLTQSSLIDESKESTFEEIQTAKMTPEEVRKRTNELRKMRELMFRQERESKRLKKIKSKQYRRIKKRELLKNKSLIEGDEDSDDEDHDARRAQERMSLKHKNNSQWARSMIKSGMSNDSEAREEMEEMLRRGERLKSKILDRDHDEDEFGDSNDMNLDKSMDEDETEDLEKVGKTGVLNMAFMKNAEARKRSENAETRANLKKLESSGDIEEFEQTGENYNGINKEWNSGRRVYTPGSKTSNEEMSQLNEKVLEEHEDDAAKSLTNRMINSNKKESIVKRNQNKETPIEQDDSDSDKENEIESNPWISNDKNVQRSKKVKVVEANSSKLDKASAKIGKQQKKRKASEISGNDEDDEIIDMNQTLKIVDPHGENSDVDDEDSGKLLTFKQKDLIKQAFAGDDVVSEFAQEKKAKIIEEDDQVEDLTLPGWGDWAGGNRKVKKNKVVKKTKGVNADKRRDKNLQSVIINEKINKKNAKYQSSAVPFPYENREQYERSLRMPIGQQWTSRETHQRLTMPKVLTKSGAVIDPLKAPFK